jgi:hypothetical protein
MSINLTLELEEHLQANISSRSADNSGARLRFCCNRLSCAFQIEQKASHLTDKALPSTSRIMSPTRTWKIICDICDDIRSRLADLSTRESSSCRPQLDHSEPQRCLQNDGANSYHSTCGWGRPCVFWSRGNGGPSIQSRRRSQRFGCFGRRLHRDLGCRLKSVRFKRSLYQALRGWIPACTGQRAPIVALWPTLHETRCIIIIKQCIPLHRKTTAAELYRVSVLYSNFVD